MLSIRSGPRTRQKISRPRSEPRREMGRRWSGRPTSSRPESRGGRTICSRPDVAFGSKSTKFSASIQCEHKSAYPPIADMRAEIVIRCFGPCADSSNASWPMAEWYWYSKSFRGAGARSRPMQRQHPDEYVFRALAKWHKVTNVWTGPEVFDLSLIAGRITCCNHYRQ